MNYSKLIRIPVFIILWLVCFLLITEAALRIISAVYSKNPRFNDISESSAFNIICLGDSFTYGLGVKPALSYPKQLERMLNNGNLNARFKIFNLAIPGSSSSQHLKCLRDILARYKKPDLVILLTGANDRWNFADSNILRVINETKKGRQRIGIRLDVLCSNLRVYKMLKLVLLNLKGKPAEFEANPMRIIPKYEDISENDLKRLLEYNLTEIVSLAKANNIGIILQNYPRGDLYGDNITERAAAGYRAGFVDNFAAFNERLKTSSYQDLFLYDISHPNERGYEIMARNLYRVIYDEVSKKHLKDE